MIERDGGFSNLCHSCRLDYQQRVLKTFLGPGCLRAKYGVVLLWHLLVSLYVYSSKFYLAAPRS